jgi:hypothetical protein
MNKGGTVVEKAKLMDKIFRIELGLVMVRAVLP